MLFDFLNSIFPFGALIILTILVCLTLSVVKYSCIFLFDVLREFFYPTPKLSEEEANKIYKAAADFVHSKHRPWMYDDTFAEYLGLVHEMSKQRWDELYGNH